MLGNINTLRTGPEDFHFGVSLALKGFYSHAFVLFSRLEQEGGKQPALFVNLALCHRRANEHDRAVAYLERALAELSKKPVPSRIVKSETFARLQASETDREYLSPMEERLPEIFPELAKETVLRLLIDSLAELSDLGRAKAFAAALKHKNYPNVIAALKE